MHGRRSRINYRPLPSCLLHSDFCLPTSLAGRPRLGRSLALPRFRWPAARTSAMHARWRESQIVCIFSGMSTERRQWDHSAASL